MIPSPCEQRSGKGIPVIHVVDAINRHKYGDMIERSYRIRHEIFVDERKWQNLDRGNGIEQDSYDTADTVYFLAIENGRIAGGHRLFPTTRSHMLSEVFPHLAAERGIPQGPDIMEWSRFFVVKEFRGGRVNMELMAALQEYGLRNGLQAVSAVFETWWLPRFHEAGFRVQPLGLPDEVDGAMTMAGLIEISPQALRKVRTVGGLTGPVLAPLDGRDRSTREPVQHSEGLHL